MAKRKNDVNKSQAIRDLLATNPDMKAKEVVSTLAGKGIKVNAPLFYFIKGKLASKKGRRRRRMAAAAGTTDAVATVMKVKKLAAELGGLSKLKALVDVLSE